LSPQASSGQASPEKEHAGFVREKFSRIARRYDLLNSLLSLGIDATWRKAVCRELPPERYPRVLDLCAGTLTLSRELLGANGTRKVMALDFCQGMLAEGRRRFSLEGDCPIPCVCADGMRVPLKDASVDAVTVAFGVRNLARPEEGIREMHRILKPGGRMIILEFSRPRSPVFAPLYGFYLNHLLPCIGGIISGDAEAYRYLAKSIGRFMTPEEVVSLSREAGFTSVRARALTMGIVTLFVGDK